MVQALSCANNENDKRKGRRQMYGRDYMQPQTSGITVDLEDFPVLCQHITVSQAYKEALSPPFHFGLQNHETVPITSDYTIHYHAQQYPSKCQFLARDQPILSLQLQCHCFVGFKISMHCSGFLLKNYNTPRNALNGKSAVPPQSFSSGSANMGDEYSKTTNSIADQVFRIVSLVFCFGPLSNWEVREDERGKKSSLLHPRFISVAVQPSPVYHLDLPIDCGFK